MPDSLTSLPDRHEFLLQAQRTLGPETDTLAGLVIAKVRSIRALNLELGYEAGDHVINALAARIRACLRPGDFLARIGATEFAILLPGLKSPIQPQLAVAKIEREVCAPVPVAGKEIRPRLCFGLSIFPEHAREAEQLVRCADLALLRACNAGSQSVTFSAEEIEPLPPSVELERGLETAIEDGELSVCYQPKVELDNGCVCGVELLSRWTSAVHGPIRPDIFIDIAERCGLIMPLTVWTLNTALRECRDWQSRYPGLSVAVNLSPIVLADPQLPELISQVLGIWNVSGELLVLEITENAMMGDPEACLAALQRLDGAGVRLSIDDFGKGYSSLSYLKELPVDELKIDRSFVQNMRENDKDQRIVQAAIDLGENFELGVVAEGVEDEESLDTLTLMGCTHAQGYFIERPVPLEELYRWLEHSDWEAPAPGGVEPEPVASDQAGIEMADSASTSSDPR